MVLRGTAWRAIAMRDIHVVVKGNSRWRRAFALKMLPAGKAVDITMAFAGRELPRAGSVLHSDDAAKWLRGSFEGRFVR